MSYNFLPLDHQDLFQNLPSLSRINNTLLMIQTVKNIPNYSLTCLDANINNDHLNQEDSLGEQIRAKEQSSLGSKLDLKGNTTDGKKKKSGCTCKKTKCLKMYCECFALGKVCTPQCACYTCCNSQDNRDLIQKSRTSAKCKSRKNTQGCTCKKSQCQKKYCECYNAGLACTQICKCCDCQNHTSHSSSQGLHSSINLDINLKQYQNEHIVNPEMVIKEVNPQIKEKLSKIRQSNLSDHLEQQSLSFEEQLVNKNKLAQNEEKSQLKTDTKQYRNQFASFGSIDVIKYIN